jgi:hypothetical protein
MIDVGPEFLFRILRGAAPDLLDFTSKAVQGVPCRDPDPAIRRL